MARRGRPPKAAPVEEPAPPPVVEAAVRVPPLPPVIRATERAIIRCPQCGSANIARNGGQIAENGVAYFKCNRCTNDTSEATTFKAIVITRAWLGPI